MFGGAWDCPVCATPVEVTVRLQPPAQAVGMVRATLQMEREARQARKKGKKDASSFLLSPVLVETFVITFLAEWGDRSQIATIGLAASSDPVGVTIGGIAGHAVCTGAAVIGGRHMAEHISERAVAIAGGVLFCLFGAHSLVTGLEE